MFSMLDWSTSYFFLFYTFYFSILDYSAILAIEFMKVVFNRLPEGVYSVLESSKFENSFFFFFLGFYFLLAWSYRCLYTSSIYLYFLSMFLNMYFDSGKTM